MSENIQEQEVNRATDSPAVDVESLKEKMFYDLNLISNTGRLYGVNEAIDYLASRNLIRGAVEPIEGLDEAIIIQETIGSTKEAGDNFLLRYKRTFESVIDKAARAYRDLTKGGGGMKTDDKTLSIDCVDIDGVQKYWDDIRVISDFTNQKAQYLSKGNGYSAIAQIEVKTLAECIRNLIRTIPDDMVLVPREPTKAMKKAYDDLVIELGLRSVVAPVFAYKTMIKAYEEGK